MGHVLDDGAFEQRAGRGGLVTIIFERVADRFRHHHRSGEVHDRAYGVVADGSADCGIILDIRLHQRGAEIDRSVEAGDEIIDDDDIIAGIAWLPI